MGIEYHQNSEVVQPRGTTDYVPFIPAVRHEGYLPISRAVRRKHGRMCRIRMVSPHRFHAMPTLSHITLYPVKALPGVDVEHAALTIRGGLVHDRQYALIGNGGAYINGKRNARIHQLNVSCHIDDGNVVVAIRSETGSKTFVLGDDAQYRSSSKELEAELSRYFDERVTVVREDTGGFPDDPDSPGPTVISAASLAAVADWYPGLTEHDMRRRFRANLEFSDCPPFWEDQLFGDPGTLVKFQVGEVSLLGSNPCKRCVVPTRDPATGIEFQGFQRTFVEQRKKSLPTWAKRSRFDLYYRLAVNTCPADNQAGKSIRVGDLVRILDI